MKSKTVNHRRSDCPISVALELFGDRWSLLIVRDLMFKQRNTFIDFINAEERIATNILTDRLHSLEIANIVTKTPHPKDTRRSIYRLTSKGLDLAPVLIEMIVWSATHEVTAAPASEVRKMRKNRDKVISDIRVQLSTSSKISP